MSRMALNIAHFKKGAVGSIAGHNWYKRGEKDQHSNQDIDPTRSKDNIGLVVPESSLYQDVKAMVDGAAGRVTANSVWLSEWVLYPPEQLQDPKTADRAELRRYYQDALDWMQQQGYHVRLAAVHLDETTVHAHIDTVPLTKDGRLSRKDVYTRANLNKIHTELAEHLASKGWDIQRGESTQGKQIRAQTVPEYKKQAEAEKMAALEQLQEAHEQAAIELDVVQTAQEMSGETLREVQALEERRDALRSEISQLHEQAQDIRHRIADAIEKADRLEGTAGQLETEVQLREEALERLDLRGSGQMGAAEWHRSVDQIRKGKAKDEQQGLLAAFAEMLIQRFPDVSQLWIDFQRRARERKPAKGKDEQVH